MYTDNDNPQYYINRSQYWNFDDAVNYDAPGKWNDYIVNDDIDFIVGHSSSIGNCYEKISNLIKYFR